MERKMRNTTTKIVLALTSPYNLNLEKTTTDEETT
jgi:hypothetical protein